MDDSLREMFIARVETPPVADDLAGIAIRRGQAVRRRQVAGSLVAAAVVFAVIIGGMASIQDWWNAGPGGRSSSVASLNIGPADSAENTYPAAAGHPADPAVTDAVEPSSPAIDTGLGLDLRVGDQLWTTDGRRLALLGVGQVTRTYAVPGGWVYAGVDQVRFLRTDGTSIALSGRDDRWVVSPDGTRLAFVLDSVLYVARIGPDGMAVLGRTDVPTNTWPIGFFGDQVAVAVDTMGIDLVDPGQPYQPAWNTDLTAVLGTRGDVFVGLVRRSGQLGLCLGDVRSAGVGLRIERTGGCALELEGGAPDGRLSPDGAWLAEQRDGEVTLINVAGALRDTARVISCPVDVTAGLAWSDDRTLVTGNERNVVRCDVDGRQRLLPLPAGVDWDWRVVPRLAAPVGASR